MVDFTKPHWALFGHFTKSLAPPMDSHRPAPLEWVFQPRQVHCVSVVPTVSGTSPISAKERGPQGAWNMAPAASQGDRNSKAMTPVAVKLVESESKKSGI